MPEPPFHPSKAVTFDLAQGRIHRDDASQHVLLGVDALVALVLGAGPNAAQELGRSLGAPMGARAMAGRGGTLGSSSVESAVDSLGHELAVAGLGALSIERWGVALVLVVDGCPLGGAGDRLVESLLTAAVSAATSRSVEACLLTRDGARARFFLGGPAGAQRLREWLGAGVGWGEALVRLHARPPSSNLATAPTLPPGRGEP